MKASIVCIREGVGGIKLECENGAEIVILSQFVRDGFYVANHGGNTSEGRMSALLEKCSERAEDK